MIDIRDERDDALVFLEGIIKDNKVKIGDIYFFFYEILYINFMLFWLLYIKGEYI